MTTHTITQLHNESWKDALARCRYMAQLHGTTYRVIRYNPETASPGAKPPSATHYESPHSIPDDGMELWNSMVDWSTDHPSATH